MIEDMPASTRFVPEDERPKSGWLGRDMARDGLDPDRAWLPEKFALTFELDRFMVEPGCGIAVLVLMPPRVCWCVLVATSSRCDGAFGRTSLGLRTLHRPVSWDMVYQEKKRKGSSRQHNLRA